MAAESAILKKSGQVKLFGSSKKLYLLKVEIECPVALTGQWISEIEGKYSLAMLPQLNIPSRKVHSDVGFNAIKPFTIFLVY